MKIRLFAWSGLAGLGALIAVAYFGTDLIALAAGILLILSAVVLLCFKRTRELPFNWIFFIIGLLLCAFYAQQQFVRIPITALAERIYTMTGWVASEAENAGNVKRFTVKTESVTDENGNSNIPQHFSILLYSTETASFGDTITAQIKLQTPYEYRGYDLADSYASKGIYVTGTCYEGFIDVIHTDKHQIPKFLQSVKTYVRIRAELAFNGRYSAFVNAIVIGDDSGVTQEDYDTIRDAGVTHLLVVSGSHTTFFALALFFIFRKLRIKRWLSSILTMGFLLFYMALLGFAPSVTRAGMMTVLVFLGQMLWRNADPLNSLGVSVAVMLFIRPYFCFDVGFLLSVSATFGILLFINQYNEGIKNFCNTKVPKVLSRPIYYIFSSVMVSFAASLFVLPILLYFFGEINTMAPLSTLLLGPVAALMLPVFILAVFGANIPFIGVVLKGASKILVDVFYFVVKKIAALPFSTLPSGYKILSFAVVIALLGIVICLLTGAIRKQTLLCILCAILMVTGGIFGQLSLNYETVTTAIFSDKDGSALAIYDGVGYIIIGCGNDAWSQFELEEHVKKYRKNADLLLVLPNPQKIYAFEPDGLTELLPAHNIVAFEPTEEEVETLYSDHISLDCYGHGTYEIYLYKDGFYAEIVTHSQTAIFVGGNPILPQKHYDYGFVLDKKCKTFPDCTTLMTVSPDPPENGITFPAEYLTVVKTMPSGLYVGAESFWK